MSLVKLTDAGAMLEQLFHGTHLVSGESFHQGFVEVSSGGS
jgi:hypothetical protein